jgi:nicotinamidase-related amidase
MEGKTPGLRFGPLRRAVHLCVDMQRMFAEDTPWATSWLQAALPEIVRFCETAADRTIFTRFIPAHDPGAAWGAWQRYYHRWPEMTLRELDPAFLDLVAPLKLFTPPAGVFDKTTYSPWTTGELRSQLVARDVDAVVVSGGETDICVLATVLGAVDAGFRTVVATDALCSSANSMHDAIVDWYHERLAEQIETATVEEIICNWDKG